MWLQLVSLLRLDTSRLHCTGFSQGGFMAWSLLERYPDFWASVAPAAAGNYGCVRSPHPPVAAQAPRVQTRSVISNPSISFRMDSRLHLVHPLCKSFPFPLQEHCIYFGIYNASNYTCTTGLSKRAV